MFEIRIDALDADGTLTHAAGLRALASRAEVGLIETAAHWADLNGALDQTGGWSVALPGTEDLVHYGGDGTPAVCEFAPAELGAELGMSFYAATCLIADALDLRHRLPLVWAKMRDGDIKPWVGRRTAELSRHLSSAAVGLVDRRVARHGHCLTWGRLSKVVEAAVIGADPDQAKTTEADRAQRHGVWLSQSTEHGTRTATIVADAVDLMHFDATVDRVADGIAILGDTATKDIRRARALGVLANPQQTLDLYTTVADTTRNTDPDDLPADITREQDPHPDGHPHHDNASDSHPGCDVSGDHTAPSPATAGARGVGCGCRGRSRLDPRPPATLYVHQSHDAITGGGTPDSAGGSPGSTGGGTGVARVEGIGPVTVEQAKARLGHGNVTVKPVIDLTGITPVDAYEIPDRIREAVHLLTPADTFPYATNTGRTMDLDHTRPYHPPGHGGPPGQTGIGNLGPMTRRHHRIKTHSPWQVKQPYPGIHLWRSPHHRYYLVDHTGTHRLPKPA